MFSFFLISLLYVRPQASRRDLPPHLRASASAGEFAAFIKGVPLQHAAKRAEPSQSEDFVSSARNKISELNSLRVPKSRFWLSAPHLRASASAGEFAAFIKGVPLQHAAKRAEPSKSEDFVSSARNKISELNSLRVPKPRFWLSAPHLRASASAGEFAAFIKGVPL